MRYDSTIEYLYGLQKHGMKFGLDNIQRLMSELGDPHKSFRSIHVAGTNGKGSTSAMIESLIRTSGVKTGLFTSPHLVSFTERVRVNGEEIAENDVIELADEVRSVSEAMEDFSPTFFEVVTAMAFLHFRKIKVDWVVVETGMGGRLDATNIIFPEASVITCISLDHREFLGNTLKEIAGEKAGIIKANVPVVTAMQEPEVLEVIKGKAVQAKSKLFIYNTDFSAELVPDILDGICFNYSGENTYPSLKLPLSGEHQMMNASTALKIIEIIQDKFPQLNIDIRGGLAGVIWPGRLEFVSDNPPVLIDGAHNPDAAVTLSNHLKKILGTKYNRLISIIGIMGDKDIKGILQPILPLSSEIIFAAPAYGRAASPDILSDHAYSLGYGSRKALNMADAIAVAEDLYMPGDLILITGSFYTIGEAKEVFGHKGILAKLRE